MIMVKLKEGHFLINLISSLNFKDFDLGSNSESKYRYIAIMNWTNYKSH